jgi:uncharacterized membrane protein YdjX (TVP38/TMEM64 family)
VTDLLLLFLIIVGVNLLPAFGPPTWSVLVLYVLHTNLPTGSVVLVGAAAAALGRYLLAVVFRLIGSHLSKRSRRNLEAARQLVERSKGKTVVGLALFALSPFPSAQLFEAAGLLRVRLLPFTAAFFAGRLVSYFIYASTAAKVRESSIGDAFREVLSHPFGIALQIVLIAVLAGVTRLDWTRLSPTGRSHELKRP